MTLRVLAAPAHYQMDSSLGSEFMWTAELVRHLSALPGLSITAVTGDAPPALDESIDILRVGLGASTGHLTLARRLGFVQRYYSVTRGVLSDHRHDVLHHILPFRLGRTFNPVALRAPDYLPFVVGPVQEPLTGDLSDEYSFEARFLRPTRPRRWDPLSIGIPAAEWLSRRTIRRADVIVATSQDAARLCTEFGANSEVLVIPPGVDCEEFSPDTSVKSGEFLFVGHLVRRKRVDLLLHALAQLRSIYRATPHLRVVGDGPQRSQLEALALALDLREQVTFEGFKDRGSLPDIYRGALAFCFPSAAETGPSVVLEALASGVPVIATEVGLTRSVLHAGTGLAVEAHPAALAAAMYRMLSEPDLRQRLGERGRSLVVRKFAWPEIASVYKHAYETAIDRRRHRYFTTQMSASEPETYSRVLHSQPKDAYGRYIRHLNPRPGALILDVGCGVGSVVEELTARGALAFGIEISPQLLDNGNHGCLAGGGDMLPFRNGTFDSVGAFTVLEHCDRPQRVLSEIVRVTKPGGTIAVAMPNFLRVVGLSAHHPRNRGLGHKAANLRSLVSKGWLRKRAPWRMSFQMMSPIIRTGAFEYDDDAICVTDPVSVRFFLERFGVEIDHQSSVLRDGPRWLSWAAQLPLVRTVTGGIFFAGRRSS